MLRSKIPKITFPSIEIRKNKNPFLIGSKPISTINKTVEFCLSINKKYKSYPTKI